MAVYCPECGAEVLEGAKFCSKCGAAIRPGWTAEAAQRPKLVLLILGPIVIALAAVGVMAYALLRSGGDESDDQAGQPTPLATAMAGHAAAAEGMVLGDADAQVTVYVYSDFQCPYCARAALEIVPRLDSEYLATGKAKLIFKIMSFIGEESRWAAEAAVCASDQGKFWEYHNKLFEEQNGENKGAFKVENLKRFAAEIGLNQGDFNTCLDEGKFTGQIADEMDEAENRGVNSTPTFFVGQTQVDTNYDAIAEAIDAALKAQGGTAEPTPVARVITEGDLGAMVLSLSDFATGYAHFDVDYERSGPVSRADLLDIACDPEDEAHDLDRTKWETGYAQWHTREPYGLFEEPYDGEPLMIGTTVDVFEDVAGAVDAFDDGMNETREEATVTCHDVSYEGIEEFEVPAMGEEAWGAVVYGRVSGRSISMTGLVFRRGRIVASVGVGHFGSVDASEEMIDLAQALDSRMSTVLGGPE